MWTDSRLLEAAHSTECFLDATDFTRTNAQGFAKKCKWPGARQSLIGGDGTAAGADWTVQPAALSSAAAKMLMHRRLKGCLMG